MFAPRQFLAVGALLLLGGCQAVTPTPQGSLPVLSPALPSSSFAAKSSPSLAPSDGGFAWVREEIDPAPGPVVTGLIASALHVVPSDVTAAVLGFRHPAGNHASIWLFRATNVPGDAVIELWWSSRGVACGIPLESTTIADFQAAVLGYALADQCQPQYVVTLDAQTALVLIDDGGYQGNAAFATPVPYRPMADAAPLVTWAAAHAAEYLGAPRPAVSPSPPDVQSAVRLVNRYVDAVVHRQFATAWELLDPAVRHAFGSLAAFSAGVYMEAAGTAFTATPNPSATRPIGYWLGSLPDDVEIDMSRSILVEVDYPRLVGNNAGWQLYIVTPTPDGSRILQVR